MSDATEVLRPYTWHLELREIETCVSRKEWLEVIDRCAEMARRAVVELALEMTRALRQAEKESK